MTSVQYSILIGSLIGCSVFAFVLGRAQRFKATTADNFLDFFCFAVLAALTQPFILCATDKLVLVLARQYKSRRSSR